MSILKKVGDRREFLRTCFRNVTLTALALLAGGLALRKHDDGAKHLCINDGLCGGCSKYSGCILPQALSAKQAKGQLN